MTRLTRAQAQARTREQLLATATEMFLRDGYAKTSIDRVAEEAGFTKGAVYGHFRTKDELCGAVLDGVRAERLGEIVTAWQTSNPDQQLAEFGRWAERHIGDPTWTRLEMEFALQASRDDSARDQLAGRAHQLIDLLSAVVRAGAEHEGVEPSLPSDEIATAVLCLGVGLGLFRLIDPTISVSAIVDVLRLLVSDQA